MNAVAVGILVFVLLAGAHALWVSRHRVGFTAKKHRRVSEYAGRAGQMADFMPDPTFVRQGPSSPTHEDARKTVDGTVYRARRATATPTEDRWDPFSSEQARATRIRAARQEAQSRVRMESQHAQSYRQRDSHYVLLGVKPTAPTKEIERAYRRSVASSHPDLFQNDPEALQEAERRLRQLNVAIAVLRDPVRRARYDALLRS